MLNKYEHLKNPPITEALISIGVELPREIEVSDLEKLQEKIKKQYPKKKTRRQWAGQFKLENEIKITSDPKADIHGYQFWSVDETKLVQFFLDSFSFNRLRPYINWTNIYNEAMKLWKIYTNRVKSIRINRLAVRYINSIEIPGDRIELEEYFRGEPKIPEPLPQIFEYFLTRRVIPFKDEAAKGIITLSAAPQKDPLKARFILDIEVRTDISLSPDHPCIGEMFLKLRDIKNKIFFSCITDKTKELFK